MRRSVLALSLGLPLVFAALPLGSLLFTERHEPYELPTVTIADESTIVPAPVDQPDPALAMRSEPQRDCSHESNPQIDG
ncbi:MAG: hypothetical protein IT303_16415 [Dehalococcoidia bacterium]|nr:hypothetical protein [Dehalococcoidia bacterium]